MNSVYELYERDSGEQRHELSESIPYWKIAKRLREDALVISNKHESQETRLSAVARLRENLTRCVMDKELDDLTSIYRDTTPTSKVNVGYEDKAVSKFIMQFANKYPEPANMKLSHQDVYEQAKKIDNYHEYTGHKELLFDTLNANHTEAFEDIVSGIVTENRPEPPNMTVESKGTTDAGDKYIVKIGDDYIMTYISNDYSYQSEWNQDASLVTKAITSNNQIIQMIQSRLNDA